MLPEFSGASMAAVKRANLQRRMAPRIPAFGEVLWEKR